MTGIPVALAVLAQPTVLANRAIPASIYGVQSNRLRLSRSLIARLARFIALPDSPTKSRNSTL